tara:strand:+ start:921 stop:1184 length:264 start_codon:yes stop_codon:yes gene_type:complete
MTEGIERGFFREGIKARPLEDACAHLRSSFGPCREVGNLGGNSVKFESRCVWFKISSLSEEALVLAMSGQVQAGCTEDGNQGAEHAP